MIALIDADSISYKYASIYQDTCIWDKSDKDNIVATVSTDWETAVSELEGFIQGIIDTTDTTEAVLILSPKRTFRYDVDENYKSNRKPPEVPLQLLTPLRDHMLNEMGALCFDDVEADDVCVSRVYQEPGKYVLCHIDKDLNQAPGPHYNYNTREFCDIDQVSADYWFYEQALTGDSVDGIKGCPKIGKVRATKLLTAVSSEEYWETIVAAYEKAGKDEDYAIQQARLVYMLRDFNEDTQEFKLWLPEEKDEE